MTSDTMLPILRELIDADGDAARAGVLLSLPDTILLKYLPPIEAALKRARFDAGLAFIDVRLSALRAVRGADGRLPAEHRVDLDRWLDAFAAVAAGSIPPPSPAATPPPASRVADGSAASSPADGRPTADPRLPGDEVAP